MRAQVLPALTALLASICPAFIATATADMTPGSLVAWGLNDQGQTDVPSGSDFVGIAAGGFHNLALRQDGSVAAWGWNAEGQTDVPGGQAFQAISAGQQHSVALPGRLREDG